MSIDHPGEEHILVIDDDAQVRTLLGRLLTLAGYTCELAGTASEGRGELERRAPDVLLLDVYLPDESGLSFAREVAARHPDTAVLMVSGEEDAGVARIALDGGAYGYITKPFKRNEITIAVENALLRRRGEHEQRQRRAALEDTVVERTAAVQDALGRLRSTEEDTVLRLAQALDLRDPAHSAHIERVSRFCALLAPRFGLDAELMREAGRLHDIGRVGLPDAILRKRGVDLTPDERAEVERHAEIGHELLHGSRSPLLDLAAVIALTHHERHDGKGYPDGLAAAQIPLPGRIAAVAEAFDALIMHRRGRAGVPVEEALATVGGGRGTRFDPEAADAFLAAAADVRAIVERFEPEPVDEAAVAAPGGEAAHDPDGGGDAPLLTLQQAAMVIGVSASTMRRWADDGRIAAVRTAGGHRRFTLESVRGFAAERGPRPVVRPIAPPAEPLLPLARLLQAAGPELAASGAGLLYRSGPAGWFAGEEGAAAIGDWLEHVVQGCETGEQADALEATDALMRLADLRGTTVLERHRFLERCAEAAVRGLSREQAPHAEIVSARRLFVAMQQNLLAAC